MQNKQNQLAGETSPYLLQHADNPVNWYPWGEEALELAISENKPILLSVGYAACHWCHVMEHESFENPETAELMNELFICIKVDREERPDIDQIYMKYVQMTTGSGGWPLNVFLTPEQQPFYGGTYFPPEDRYGRPSWRKVLRSVSNFYHNQKKELQENLDIIKDEFHKSQLEGDLSDIPDQDHLNKCVIKLSSMYDSQYGGLGRAPKFPAIYPLSVFLRHYKYSGDEHYLNMVRHSLTQMAKGGIYDQIGGGFARYSVDEKWLVPHFEKMLYDNAQLVPLYLDTYLLTNDQYFLQIVVETLQFVHRELMSPKGGFYSSLDADSEGIEGKYYVWKKSEIINELGQTNGEIFCDYYDVSEQGNFEHKNILNVRTDIATFAKRFGLLENEIIDILAESRRKLLAVREKRIRPGLDDKMLTSWNGLMLSAFSRAFQVTRESSYEEIMKKNISFIQSNLFSGNHLMRTYNKNQAKYHGYLDDYAFMIQGLLDAYEAIFNISYIDWAHQLLEYTNTKFWDENNAGYFYTSVDQEDLIERLKDEHDQSIPSGSAVMLLNNLRFYSLTENPEYLNLAEQILKKYGDRLLSNPYGYASYLSGLDFYLQKPKEIVLVIPEGEDSESVLKSIFGSYIPNKVVVTLNGKNTDRTLSASLLQGKHAIDGQITAYICHNFACSQPVTTAEELEKLLQK